MAVTIRPASASDVEQILALAPRLTEGVASWREPTAVRKAVVRWVEDSLAGRHTDDQTVLVAETAGSVHGFITVTHHRHWTGSLDGYIGELVVSPAAEGRRIGSALVRAAIEWSREQGFERVSVATGAANKRARRIYERLGLQEEGITLSVAT